MVHVFQAVKTTIVWMSVVTVQLSTRGAGNYDNIIAILTMNWKYWAILAKTYKFRRNVSNNMEIPHNFIEIILSSKLLNETNQHFCPLNMRSSKRKEFLMWRHLVGAKWRRHCCRKRCVPIFYIFWFRINNYDKNVWISIFGILKWNLLKKVLLFRCLIDHRFSIIDSIISVGR